MRNRQDFDANIRQGIAQKLHLPYRDILAADVEDLSAGRLLHVQILCTTPDTLAAIFSTLNRPSISLRFAQFIHQSDHLCITYLEKKKETP